MLKRIVLSTIFILLFAQVLMANPSYDQIRIWSDNTRSTLQELLALGIDPEGLNIRRDVYIDAIVGQNEKQKIMDQGMVSEDIILDISNYYESRLNLDIDRDLGYGSMGGYLTLSEIIESMDSLHAQYPDIVSQKDSIGESHEGRAIWAFKISDNHELDEEEPEVFYNSLIHAREPAAMMTLMHFAWELAENYNSDPILRYLVNEREMWFVPVVNPDGYAYNEWTNPGGGGMHRKNRRPGCSSLPGVDLNRNWGFNWGYNDVGSSPDSCSNTYRGDAPFSEPETEAIRNFVLSHNFQTVFNYHSYGNLLIRPFGYDSNADIPEPDNGIYQELGNDLTAENHYLFGTGDETVGYSVNGDAVDYMYGELGIISFTPEVGRWSEGGFWPSMDLIFDLAEANMPMNTHLAGVAGAWIRLEDFTFISDDALQEGDVLTSQLIVRNKGFGSENGQVTLELESPDSSLLITTTSFDISLLPPQMSTDLGGADLDFEVNTESGNEATLIIRINVGGEYVVADTFAWAIGLADTIFVDDFEAGLNRWSSENWGVTSDAFSGDQAMTDSPTGFYPESATIVTTLIDPIDLRGYLNPILSFDAKWNIELDYDFCQVLASADGGLNWSALRGDYTVSGNGATVQPLGEPGYNGSHDWVHDELSLEQVAGNPAVLLAFQTMSDTYYEDDGFVVDNLSIQAWGIGFHLGDITRDGLIDVNDAVLLLEWIMDNLALEGDFLELSDMNKDDQVDIIDLILIIETALLP